MLNANALTTLEKAKTILGIDSSDTKYDELVELYINAASDSIEGICKRKLGQAEYTEEKYSGSGTVSLQLNQYPVSVLTSVKEGVQSVSDCTLHSDTGVIKRASVFTAGVDNYSVSYKAGYLLPKDASDSSSVSLPAAIQTACLLFVKLMYNGELSKQYERIGDYTVIYRKDDSEAMPYAVKVLITPYIRRDS